MVFRTFGVSANPSLEIEDPFCRCSVQKHNTAVTSIVKIPYFLNYLADRVICVMVRKQVELPMVLVFNSRTNPFGNSSIFAFYLLLFTLYIFLYLLFELLIMELVTFLCLRFRWSRTITPTTTSLRTGGCVPQASIVRGSRECYTTHSSVFAMMATLRSTVADCPRPMAWTSVWSA
jgi:hypothetical protein